MMGTATWGHSRQRQLGWTKKIRKMKQVGTIGLELAEEPVGTVPVLVGLGESAAAGEGPCAGVSLLLAERVDLRCGGGIETRRETWWTREWCRSCRHLAMQSPSRTGRVLSAGAGSTATLCVIANDCDGVPDPDGRRHQAGLRGRRAGCLRRCLSWLRPARSRLSASPCRMPRLREPVTSSQPCSLMPYRWLFSSRWRLCWEREMHPGSLSK